MWKCEHGVERSEGEERGGKDKCDTYVSEITCGVVAEILSAPLLRFFFFLLSFCSFFSTRCAVAAPGHSFRSLAGPPLSLHSEHTESPPSPTIIPPIDGWPCCFFFIFILLPFVPFAFALTQQNLLRAFVLIALIGCLFFLSVVVPLWFAGEFVFRHACFYSNELLLK